MIGILTLLLLVNMVAYPTLWVGEALLRFAMNKDISGEYLLAYRYQDLKYKWLFSDFNEGDEYLLLWCLFDLIVGLLTMFALVVFGHWMLIPIVILGVVLGSRWYFQNKEK